MQALKLEGCSPSPALQENNPDDFAIVRRGDTLQLIASRNHVSVDELLKANPGIKDRNKITPGMEIQIPETARTKTPEKKQALPEIESSAQPQICAVPADTLKADAIQFELNKRLDVCKPAVSKADKEQINEMIASSDHWDANKMTDRLFFERHPDLKGKEINTAEAREWTQMKSEIVDPLVKEAADKKAADVVTKWDEKYLHTDSSDNAAADKIFNERHPELQGKNLKAGSAEAKEWKDIRIEVAQNKYNDWLKAAAREFPGLDPKVLKSLLMTESNFQPDVVNEYGYAGIAQFGKTAARSVGMTVNSTTDDRLNPEKAIPGAAKHLKDKATSLQEAFKNYGTPMGDEYWKFVMGAYNGGEGTIGKAMEHAYNKGLDDAKKNGLTGDAATEHARNHASRWENLLKPTDDIEKSPLFKATHQYFKEIDKLKYDEIGQYPVSIMKRARQ